MATQNMTMPNVPNSGNAALTHTFKVVRDLSIAAVVLSSVILITGLLGLFVPYVGVFAVGMLVGFNTFWVGCLVNLT